MKMEAIKQKLATHTHPILFATIVGSHGFGTSTDYSDIDIHGVHVLPLHQLIGFEPNQDETIERKEDATKDHAKLEIATHDLRKFARLMLKSNGNVLEDLFSPFVIQTSRVHERLKEIAPLCISKKCANHYLGMAQNQQHSLASHEVKKILHMYRCYLTGLHLMETGKMEIDLLTLAKWQGVYQWEVREVVELKYAGESFPSKEQIQRHLSHLEDLRLELEMARDRSELYETPDPAARVLLEHLIIETRLTECVEVKNGSSGNEPIL